MADTIREKIIQGITTNLAKILTTGGYNTNCGQLVLRAGEIGSIDKLPAIAVKIGQDSATPTRYQSDTIEMPIEIMAASDYTFGASQDVDKLTISQLGEKILGDIRKAMGLSLPYVDDVVYTTGGIQDYPEERSDEIAVIVICEYIIKYQTIHNDPYNQN